MERIQITGGGNGVYTDSKGRRLYTMGDYSPAVGAWVWTNGTTIYGHQSATQQPFIFNKENPAPFIGRTRTTEGLFYLNNKYSYLRNSNGIYGLVTRGKYKYIITDVVESETATGAFDPEWGYGVSDPHRNSDDYYNYTWVNINTGQKLGTWHVYDAAIDNNGNLLTIGGRTQQLYSFVNHRKILDGFIEVRTNGSVIEKIFFKKLCPKLDYFMRNTRFYKPPIYYREPFIQVTTAKIYENGDYYAFIGGIASGYKLAGPFDIVNVLALTDTFEFKGNIANKLDETNLVTANKWNNSKAIKLNDEYYLKDIIYGAQNPNFPEDPSYTWPNFTFERATLINPQGKIVCTLDRNELGTTSLYIDMLVLKKHGHVYIYNHRDIIRVDGGKAHKVFPLTQNENTDLDYRDGYIAYGARNYSLRALDKVSIRKILR